MSDLDTAKHKFSKYQSLFKHSSNNPESQKTYGGKALKWGNQLRDMGVSTDPQTGGGLMIK
jgi:hypothetical protein